MKGKKIEGFLPPHRVRVSVPKSLFDSVTAYRLGKRCADLPACLDIGNLFNCLLAWLPRNRFFTFRSDRQRLRRAEFACILKWEE